MTRQTPAERKRRREIHDALTEGMHVVDTVNRWAEYLTDQDRQIMVNMLNGLGLREGSGPKLRIMQ